MPSPEVSNDSRWSLEANRMTRSMHHISLQSLLQVMIVSPELTTGIDAIGALDE